MDYFTKQKPVDRVDGPVDQERRRFTIDSRHRATKSSPEQALAGVVGLSCSPRVGKKVEEEPAFLTEGFTGESDREVRPAAVNQGGGGLELGGEASRPRMENVD
jgi:hypothetical protein